MKLRITHPRLTLDRRFVRFEALLLALVLTLTVTTGYLKADTGTCSGQSLTLPFTDVMGNSAFCFIAEVFFLGITSGTTPTTYSPNANVTRAQMAIFLDRTHDSAVKRGSRRAALNQFWTTTPQYTIPQDGEPLGTTPVGTNPSLVASDGADLWVASNLSNAVHRVRASDGRLPEGWTGATAAVGVLVAMGRVFVTGLTNPGRLYLIDPSQEPGAVTTLSSALGAFSEGIAFNGQKIWTANNGTVSIITTGAPYTVTNVGGFGDLNGILYDGANIWVTEQGTPGSLKKLDASGGVLQTVTVGNDSQIPIFDGTNIWAPNFTSNSVSVVRAATGEVLATLTGNGLNGPISAAFDGQRILVTNAGNSVSLFRGADFAPLGSFSTGADSSPIGACSDGLNFWITLQGPDRLARF